MRDTRRPASRRRSAFATAGAILILVGLLSGGLAGCGEVSLFSGGEAPPITGTTLLQAVAGAEQDDEIAENPATFISLCSNCHDRLDRELDWRRERKLIFNHPAHFARGIRCAACHQEFPHKPGRIVHVSVETCFTCHGTTHGTQGDLAPDACDTCHTSDIAPDTPSHREATWVKLPGDGLGLHSTDAKQRRLYCKMCHEQTDCDSCHRVAIPHPEGWASEAHREAGSLEREACFMCHDQGVKLCNDCHHNAYEVLPDWTAQHRRVATSRGAESCYGCHDPNYCERCHVMTGKLRGVLGG